MSDTAFTAANVGPGDKIADYRLEEQIGQGGMAVVYRAHDERLNRQVALKLLAPALADDAAFRVRFIRESHVAASVEHPNIIPVYDAGEVDGLLFISMRYVQGGDVRSLLAGGQKLSAGRVAGIISQIARALDAAHAKGLIHRDVKPANMLLDPPSAASEDTGPSSAGPMEHAYLSDFGVSRQVVASHLTSTGQFVGTLDYIAPEQIEGHLIDGQADQYSLACAAHELLTGSPPFKRSHSLAVISAHLTAPPPPVTATRPDLYGAVDLVIARAMAKAPAQRYRTCADFADELGRALLGAPTVTSIRRPPAPPTVTPVRPRRRGRRDQVLALIAGVIIAAVVAIGTTAIFSYDPKSGPVKSLAAGQVRAMNSVLATSTTSRTALANLVNNVFQCHDLPADISRLQQIADQRSFELSKAEGLDVGAIAGGRALKSELISALKLSLRIDLDYNLWAKLQQGHCPNNAGRSYLNQAQQGDNEVTAAKAAFTDSWAPIAARYGYPAHPGF